ncbi:MAG TPA: GxxExxY protein [Anaerohalosphaeraceae bacterium]|nr:GxxExxY protein [Anaerohalosphaeraceae bacterium]
MKPQITQISQIDKRDELAYAIIGAAMEVHRELGPGFLEAVYQEALQVELAGRDIPFLAQPQVRLYYKQQPLEKYYKPDFICFDSYVVEIKAESGLTKVDEAQIINVLKAARMKVGLLINFGQPSLKFQRFIYG